MYKTPSVGQISKKTMTFGIQSSRQIFNIPGRVFVRQHLSRVTNIVIDKSKSAKVSPPHQLRRLESTCGRGISTRSKI